MPFPGTRAPDATGLTRSASRPDPAVHVLGRTGTRCSGMRVTAPPGRRPPAAAAAAAEAAHGEMEAYPVVAPGVDTGWTPVPVLRDADGQFAAAYHAARARSSCSARTATSATEATRPTSTP